MDDDKKAARPGARDRLLTAARTLFADEGYERTTVRAVARSAEADPALVIRYFGSKEGLFAQAAEIDLRFPDFSAFPRAEHGARLVRHVLAIWDGPEGAILRPMLRACATHEAAAARAREIFGSQVLGMVRSLGVAEAERRTGLVATQVLGFVFCRYVLALPVISAMGADGAAASLGPTLQRYLHGDLDAA